MIWHDLIWEMVLQLVAHHGALQHFFAGCFDTFSPRTGWIPKYHAVITSVNFLFHFFNNWSMLSAKLWADSVYSSLKIRFSHRDPRWSIGNFGTIGTFRNPSFRPKSTRRHLGWGDEHRQEHLGAKPQRPCSTAPIAKFIPIWFICNKSHGKSDFAYG